jgi:ammonium transporter, Amt family
MAHRWTDKLSLRSKATIAVALVTITTLITVAGIGVLQMRRLVANQEHETVDAVAQGIGHAAELSLAVRDERELARLSERFMRNDQILMIAVYDDAGKLVTKRTRTPAIWENYLRGNQGGNLLLCEQPVTLGAAENEFSSATDLLTDPSTSAGGATRKPNVGRVVVGLSAEPALIAQRQQVQLTVITTLLAVAVSTIVVFGLVNTLTRRLNRLVVASERISQGDFDAAIDEARHDEIGRLSGAYENMRQAVQQRDAELRHFNNTLQDQVQERTLALAQALQATDVILESMPAGIMLVGSDRCVRWVNHAALTLMGLQSKAEIVGTTCHQRVCPTPKGQCPVWDCGREVENAERTLVRADGTQLPILKTVVPIVYKDEKVLLEAFVDITAQKRSEATLKAAKEAAEAADRAKSRFLATMSHEIRTPLNGVVGTVDLLRQTNLDENQRRYTQIAKSSAEALLTVINDILDFSKIEAGRMELDVVVFAPHELVEDVTRTAALVAARKNIEISCLVDPSVSVLARGDSGRLRQILTNLLNNAIKFTEQGHIVVRVTADQPEEGNSLVRFSVSDTGIGIPADRLDRLFSSFSQVDSSTTRKYGGSGLGLAISKRLAELMGGTIGVESAVGKGSTFWFTVCLATAGLTKSAPSPIPPDMRRLRVIAVDDNAVNCEILQQQLSLWNLEGTTASNGSQALQMMREAAERGTPFDLAILDWHMPGMDGLELAKAIRACDTLQGVKLIMLTSIEDQICSTELRELGFSGYLIKPVGQSQLFDTISSAFKKLAPPPVHGSTAAAATPVTESPATRSTIHVLLAEDNEINQMVAAAILAKAGFACDIVDNGVRAVEAALTGRYDVVLMDCQMPEMDGFEAAREIRKRETEKGVPQDARLPIVALTANAIKGDRETCLQAGMDDYVSKPIDHFKLCAAIRSVIARSQWRRTTELSSRAADSSNPPALTDTASSGRCPTAPMGVSRVMGRFPQALNDPDAPQPPETAASMNAPPLNVGELCARCLNNVDFTRRILSKFQDRVSEDLACLARTIADKKMAEAARLAHSLKGSAANLAAPAVRAAAAEIETLSRAGDVAQAEEALQCLRAEVERCLAYIPQAIAGLSPAPLDKTRL